jgi:hypothetical protein
VRPRDGVDDREPETASAATACVVAPREAFEGARSDLGRESPSLVPDVELDHLTGPPGADRDRPVAVAERVVDEVAERLLEPEPIRRDLDASRDLDRDPSALARRALAEAVGGGPRQLVEIDRLDPQTERLPVGARNQEKILREPDEPVGLLGGRADGRAELLGAPGATESELDIRIKQ